MYFMYNVTYFIYYVFYTYLLFYVYLCILMTILRAFMLNKKIKYGKNIYVLAYSIFLYMNK